MDLPVAVLLAKVKTCENFRYWPYDVEAFHPSAKAMISIRSILSKQEMASQTTAPGDVPGVPRQLRLMDLHEDCLKGAVLYKVQTQDQNKQVQRTCMGVKTTSCDQA